MISFKIYKVQADRGNGLKNIWREGWFLFSFIPLYTKDRMFAS